MIMFEHKVLYRPESRDNLTLPVVLEGTHQYLSNKHYEHFSAFKINR